MFEELNSELIEIRQKLRIRQKLLADIENAQTMLMEKKSILRNLESIFEKEDADVKKLEGLSLTGLFYSILGDKESQLNKERQEFLSAKLKYDECKYSISALEREIEGFKVRLAALGELDNRYEAVVQEKERLISQSTDENSRKLLELSESISDTQSDLKELHEAIAAGKKVLNGLDEVISSLKSAKNWGTFDLLGGGLITTAVKHSRIDSAKESIHQVQQQLRFFQRELADVGVKTEIKIELDSFTKFADYVFDGLIFDWITQSKINRSLESVVKLSERINRSLRHLQNSYKDVQSKCKMLEDKKRTLLENA